MLNIASTLCNKVNESSVASRMLTAFSGQLRLQTGFVVIFKGRNDGQFGGTFAKDSAMAWNGSGFPVTACWAVEAGACAGTRGTSVVPLTDKAGCMVPFFHVYIVSIAFRHLYITQIVLPSALSASKDLVDWEPLETALLTPVRENQMVGYSSLAQIWF